MKKDSKSKVLKSKPTTSTVINYEVERRVLSQPNHVAFIKLLRTLHLSTQITLIVFSCTNHDKKRLKVCKICIQNKTK